MAVEFEDIATARLHRNSDGGLILSKAYRPPQGSGGAGDFVANVFVLAQALDPVTLSTSAARSNSRNTLGMHGAGPIEMLAREMTMELQAQVAGLPDGDHTLSTKGVTFDVTVEGGEVVAAEGVDTDLVVKPFHQAGKVVSLREFSANAMNHHHGMQAEERFDLNPAKGFDRDFDADGVSRELTLGDLTALSLWQAQLATPVQVRPLDRLERIHVRRGERLFADIGCADCHTPEMTLESRMYVEPNPFNPQTAVRFDLSVATRVTLVVHDLAGRRVRTLVRGEMLLEDLGVSRDDTGQLVEALRRDNYKLVRAAFTSAAKSS